MGARGPGLKTLTDLVQEGCNRRNRHTLTPVPKTSNLQVTESTKSREPIRDPPQSALRLMTLPLVAPATESIREVGHERKNQ